MARPCLPLVFQLWLAPQHDHAIPPSRVRGAGIQSNRMCARLWPASTSWPCTRAQRTKQRKNSRASPSSSHRRRRRRRRGGRQGRPVSCLAGPHDRAPVVRRSSTAKQAHARVTRPATSLTQRLDDPAPPRRHRRAPVRGRASEVFPPVT
jgi:hypothetical protein